MATDKTKRKTVKDKVSLDSQARLMQVMNDSPSMAKLANTEWAITALKPGTVNLIAQEACGIKYNEKEAEVNGGGYVDALQFIGSSMDKCIRVIVLALLNDKDRIEGEEYNTVFETIKWESTVYEWAFLLKEILDLIDTSFFFATTNAIQTFRKMTALRKMTKKEAESLSPEQN